MLETYATLKRKTANTLGKTNDGTAVTLRDNAINDAINQIYHESRWSWLLTSTSTALTAGVFDLPADYNPSMGLESVYTAVTGTSNDYKYTRIAVGDLDKYTTSDYVYWIDYNTTNDRYRFNSNQTSGTVVTYYFRVPAELSGVEVCVVPDPQAVVYLSVAKYWLASERDEDNYDRFYQKYLERLSQMKTNDRSNNTMRKGMRNPIDEIDGSGTEILTTER